MVAQTQAQGQMTDSREATRVEERMNLLRLSFDDLPYMSSHWETEPEAATGAYELEWDDWIAQVEGFCQQHDDGKLTPEENQALRNTLSTLKECEPFAVQLDLYIPDSLRERM